uniref:Ig-like domain-containing protein n=1 Tax=Anser brachyrhynchus TaxID=132585 RepID=A0A8B9BHR9_9AVES
GTVAASHYLLKRGLLLKKFMSQRLISDYSTFVGASACFQCLVTGSPYPSVHWYKDEMLLEGDRYCVQEEQGGSHSLTIENLMQSDSGKYKCIATNRAGTAETCAVLTAPVFLKQVSDVEVWQGDVARLSVTVTGSPTPKILWFFSDVKLTPSSDCKLVFAGNDHSLILPYVGMQDEGKYTCMASNVHGEAACSAHLHVRQRVPGAPCFARAPDSVQCFLCTVSGTPVIEVAWQKDGTTISPSDHHKISKVENKHVLEISLLTTSDRGVYTCKASNKFGADICQAEMVIIDKPHFIKVLQSVQSAVNKKIRLECQVDEDRKVTVGWTKDGNKIPPGKDYKIYFEDKIASHFLPARTPTVFEEDRKH